jgi:large subunit ribosomal protein L13e
VDLLRPVVRGQTNKYNTRIRAGRGFTYDELKSAGIRRREALGVGIPIDHRRKNRSEDAFQANVARLKLYRSKLVVFPRNPTSQRAKRGDSSKADLAKAVQVALPHVLAIDPATANTVHHVKARKIAKDEREFEAKKTLNKLRKDEKLKGRREKRAKDKKDGKTRAQKKEEDAGMDE